MWSASEISTSSACDRGAASSSSSLSRVCSTASSCLPWSQSLAVTASSAFWRSWPVVGPASQLEALLRRHRHRLGVLAHPGEPGVVEAQPGAGREVVVVGELVAALQDRRELADRRVARDPMHASADLDAARVRGSRAVGVARRARLSRPPRGRGACPGRRASRAAPPRRRRPGRRGARPRRR